MPYSQALDIYKDPNSTVVDYLTAAFELGEQYGHIAGAVDRGLREDAASELLRIVILLEALKKKIEIIT